MPMLKTMEALMRRPRHFVSNVHQKTFGNLYAKAPDQRYMGPPVHCTMFTKAVI